ncbi:hypothetical protein BJ508DRAFT_377834 [Ascobolus immersus RN42]|uniref:Uncharacterized protein n=1 Tax=Ascobolus immersus RN42 TaxID=1160509 RepID=A0A3N4I153_ASCIM|nr:hypothetical protein BJ508DRAFT_377834 [Ascobolus immersus RN42]
MSTKPTILKVSAVSASLAKKNIAALLIKTAAAAAGASNPVASVVHEAGKLASKIVGSAGEAGGQSGRGGMKGGKRGDGWESFVFVGILGSVFGACIWTTNQALNYVGVTKGTVQTGHMIGMMMT